MGTKQNDIFVGRLDVAKRCYPNSDADFRDVDYLHCHGRTRDAIFYSMLLIPEFLVIEDSVILKHRVNDRESVSRFLAYLLREDATQSDAEASFNIVDVAYIFGAEREDEVSEDEIDLLARIIRDAWDAWLHHLFPERRFVVEYIPAEENGDEVAVTFYQDRS